MLFQYKVRNSDGSLGEMKKFGVEETLEEKATRSEQENQLLLNSMREMSSYMANQEHRLAEQEKAIIELSMLMDNRFKGGKQNV